MLGLEPIACIVGNFTSFLPPARPAVIGHLNVVAPLAVMCSVVAVLAYCWTWVLGVLPHRAALLGGLLPIGTCQVSRVFAGSPLRGPVLRTPTSRTRGLPPAAAPGALPIVTAGRCCWWERLHMRRSHLVHKSDIMNLLGCDKLVCEQVTNSFG